MDTRQKVFEHLATIVTKIKVPELIALGEDNSMSTGALLDISYGDKNDTVAFRAAWILEYIATHHPDRFMPVFDAFMSRLPVQRNLSCQRHFTKILMAITHPRAPQPYRKAYRAMDRLPLVETIFSWLIDPRTPVAVQVNCLDILYNMSDEFGWIREELKQQTEFLLRDGSAAMQSRGKKILKKLSRSKPQVDADGQ